MVRGDKSTYSSRQKRQAHHIEVAYEKRGIGEKEAEKRGWATVNKLNGGEKLSSSGRKPASSKKTNSSSTSRMGKSAARNHLRPKNPASLIMKKTHVKSTGGTASRSSNSRATGTLAGKKPTSTTAAKRTAARPTVKKSSGNIKGKFCKTPCGN